MEILRHLFISEDGGLLPRWRQAFPKATGGRFDQFGELPPACDLAWLRLSRQTPAAAQLVAFKKRFSATPFVILSDLPTDPEGIASFATGARGYCNSHATADVLRQVGAVASQGGIWIGESLMQRLVAVTDDLVITSTTENSKIGSLTVRELEVAQAIASGASNKEIAAKMGITERTVKAHVGAVLEKLGVRDRLQIALLLKARHSS